MKISKIERATKRTPAYHIYSDETLLLTITEETLIQFHLNKGMEISEDEWETIDRFDQVQWCLLQAVRYLSRRGHFELELKQKLRTKGFAKDIITLALKQLKQKHYLDDAKIMEQFVHDGVHIRNYGPQLLTKKLLAKGIPFEAIKAYLAIAYPESTQSKIAHYLFHKKLRALSKHLSPAQRRKKMAAFLRQRGFDWHIIQPLVDSLPAE